MEAISGILEFKTFNGNSTGDIARYIRNHIDTAEYGEFELYIGCDSLPPKRMVTTFGIVIVIYRIGKGGHIIYRRIQENDKKFKRTRDRLWHEVELSVLVAQYLKDSGLLEIDTKLKKLKSIDIHVDLNPKKEFLSNEIYAAATGFVKGCGFNWNAKPDAPAASYAADAVCRW